jgi:peptidoglycan/xylan/chitin deacetylase (PgdA/CDA1 family)
MISPRALLWRTAERLGALRIWQLAGTHGSLTVIGLHRVLPLDDDRWPWAIPEFTITDRLFSSSLDFLARRFTVVDPDRVLAALSDGDPLPPRALLVTIDDGWMDAVDVAAPILSRKGLPSLLFVAVGHVGSEHGIWQNELHARLHFNGAAAVVEALRVQTDLSVSLPDVVNLSHVFDALCESLEPLAPAQRRAVLDRLGTLPSRRGSPQFVTPADLRTAGSLGMALGLHGMTHERLTGEVDLDLELITARDRLAGWLGREPASLRTMSLPHGRYSPSVLARARTAGYDAIFTSELTVTPLRLHRPTASVFGRLWIGQRSLATDRGELETSAFYSRLLRAPRRVPAETPSPWFRS